jgi:hypothetical protein
MLQFMIMGQAAGIVAALSLGSDVQQVNVDTMHLYLLKQHQLLCLSCQQV